MSDYGTTIIYTRGGRHRKMLTVDLNDPVPEGMEPEDGPVISLTYGGQPYVEQHYLPAMPPAQVTHGHQPWGTTQHAPIDLVIIDDDDEEEESTNSGRQGLVSVVGAGLVQESGRASVVQGLQAAASVQGSGRTLVVGAAAPGESSARPAVNQRNTRRRIRPPQRYIQMEGPSSYVPVRVRPVAPPPPPPSPPPPPPSREVTYMCPICMGTLTDQVTTRCGHIFCKPCIKTAISAEPKCPTCRHKVTNRDIHRVYLPATN